MPSRRSTATLLAALLFVAATAAFAQPQDQRAAAPALAAAEPADLVIQGAVDSELQPLLAALEGKEQIQIGAWTFWRGRLAGRRVVVSRTEVGSANAAAATTLAIVNFRPRLIINQGTAGAADPALKVFDIIVGEATVDYGAFQSSHAGVGAGIDQARWTPMPHRIRLDGGDRVEFKTFPGDADMMRAALATPNPRGRVLPGIIGSAYEFNRELDRLTWIRKTYGAVSEDMESAYAAAVAAGFKTPFLAIRIISDSDYYAPGIHPDAASRCAAFVAALVGRVPLPPTGR